MAFAAIYFSSLIDIIDQEGWSRANQLQSLGLTEVDLAMPSRRIDKADLVEHFSKAAEILDCPHIGVLIGHKFRVATFVETGSVLAYAHTLAHAVELNSRYQVLAESAGRSFLHREEDRSFLRWDANYQDSYAYRQLPEIIFSGYVTTVRWLAWAHRKDVKSLNFRHAAPPYADQYAEILQCPVYFDREHNALEFFADTIDATLPTSNPDKLANVTQRLDRILQGTVSESDLSRRVRASIRTLLHDGAATLESVAQNMDMSERTLRRNLANENLRFRDVVDTVRKGMFDSLVARDVPLTDIAQILGYNDQSAFNRAFKRWYGVSPSQYRAEPLRF